METIYYNSVQWEYWRPRTCKGKFCVRL